MIGLKTRLVMLPSTYCPCLYVLHNNVSAYIDTGYQITQTDIDIEIKYFNEWYVSNPGIETKIGGSGKNVGSDADLSFGRFYHGRRQIWDGYNIDTGIAFSDGQIAKETFDGKTAIQTIETSDGGKFSHKSTRNFSESGQNVYLFKQSGFYDKPSPATSKIYYFKLWEKGTLIRYLVPALELSTQLYGMYDLVGNKFYTSPEGSKFAGGV